MQAKLIKPPLSRPRWQLPKRMATSTGSTTDCFRIELKIATLDDTAEPNDATGARIRYLTRQGIAAPEAAVSSSSIAGRVALPAQREISNPTMNSLRPQYQRSPLDHIVRSLGNWRVFGNPMTPQDNRHYFNVEFDLGSNDL
ncbi:hypothetical protein B0H14DRAFT_3429852 [Mycena olivaceomarginata]|nr:hypothetical protein B0H14DRAFT_3429852 [Mycena olivaceomarginata]